MQLAFYRLLCPSAYLSDPSTGSGRPSGMVIKNCEMAVAIPKTGGVVSKETTSQKIDINYPKYIQVTAALQNQNHRR
jgi:hypothetical protein